VKTFKILSGTTGHIHPLVSSSFAKVYNFTKACYIISAATKLLGLRYFNKTAFEIKFI
jgi:hypothetical protein